MMKNKEFLQSTHFNDDCPLRNWTKILQKILGKSGKRFRRRKTSVADPQVLLWGSGSRIQKMSLWIRILGGED